MRTRSWVWTLTNGGGGISAAPTSSSLKVTRPVVGIDGVSDPGHLHRLGDVPAIRGADGDGEEVTELGVPEHPVPVGVVRVIHRPDGDGGDPQLVALVTLQVTLGQEHDLGVGVVLQIGSPVGPHVVDGLGVLVLDGLHGGANPSELDQVDHPCPVPVRVERLDHGGVVHHRGGQVDLGLGCSRASPGCWLARVSVSSQSRALKVALPSKEQKN